MMRAIIIDDEQIGINALKILIEQHTEGLKVVASTTDPREGISLIENYKPEVVFLDVSMPKMDGFELLEKLEFRDFSLVFTTAHEEYAIKAIKQKANDYILKPIDVKELKSCVAGIIRQRHENFPEKNTKKLIELSVKNGIIFIKPEEIIRLEASGSYTVFYLDEKIRHVASKNLKECEKMLDHPHFFRCHPSHIINLSKVVKMVSSEGLFAQMKDGSMPEITRKNKDLFLERLKSI